MASKTQTLAPELQDAIVTIAKKAIAGARQSSGTISRMKDSGISFERDNTDPVALGVLGSRKRHDETLGQVQTFFLPVLDAAHRVEIARAIDERFKKGGGQ